MTDMNSETPAAGGLAPELGQNTVSEVDLAGVLLDFPEAERELLGKSQLAVTEMWSVEKQGELQSVMAQLPEEAREVIESRHQRMNQLYRERVFELSGERRPAVVASRIREMAAESAQERYQKEQQEQKQKERLTTETHPAFVETQERVATRQEDLNKVFQKKQEQEEPLTTETHPAFVEMQERVVARQEELNKVFQKKQEQEEPITTDTPEMDMVKTLTENAGPYDKAEVELLRDLSAEGSAAREAEIARIMKSMKDIESPNRFGAEPENSMRLRAEAILDRALQMEADARMEADRKLDDEGIERRKRESVKYNKGESLRSSQGMKDALKAQRETEKTVKKTMETRNKIFDVLRASFPDASDEELMKRVNEAMDQHRLELEGDIPPAVTAVTPELPAEDTPVDPEAESKLPAPVQRVVRKLQAVGRKIFTREALAKAVTMAGAIVLAPEVATGVAWGVGAFLAYKIGKTGYNAARVIKEKGFKATKEQAWEEIGERANNAYESLREFFSSWKVQDYERDRKGYNDKVKVRRFLTARAMRVGGIAAGVPLGLAAAALVEMPQNVVVKIGAFAAGYTEATLAAHLAGFIPRRIVDLIDWRIKKQQEERQAAGEDEPAYVPGSDFRRAMADMAATATAVAFAAELCGVMDAKVPGEVGGTETPEESEKPGKPETPGEPEEPIILKPEGPPAPPSVETELDIAGEGTIPVTTDTATIPHGYTFDGKTVTMPVTQIGTTGPIQGIQTLFREAVGEGGAEIIGEMQEKFDLLGAHINARVVSAGDIVNVAGNPEAALGWAQEMGYDNVGDFAKGMNAWGTSAGITTWKFPVAILKNAMEPIN